MPDNIAAVYYKVPIFFNFLWRTELCREVRKMGKITVFDWGGKDGPLESNYWGGNHDFVLQKP